METTIEFTATIEDGAMTIRRTDGQPISVMTHDEISKPVELLVFGLTGNAVKACQALLNCHGAHLEVDGIFGNLTQTALLIYQDACGMEATGECDLLTWQRLIGE